jgi:hypothetical protein
MQKAQLQAVFLPELFTRIWEKWGPLTLEDLTAFFAASTHVDGELARALARDLRRLFTGDHEGALYTGAAHVETLARRLVLACAQPAYRTQRANAPGQYIGLGALFSALQVAGLEESWTRFLHGLLSSPMGLNYRNELLHGFELETSETTAALLFVWPAAWALVRQRVTAASGGVARHGARICRRSRLAPWSASRHNRRVDTDFYRAVVRLCIRPLPRRRQADSS